MKQHADDGPRGDDGPLAGEGPTLLDPLAGDRQGDARRESSAPEDPAFYLKDTDDP